MKTKKDMFHLHGFKIDCNAELVTRKDKNRGYIPIPFFDVSYAQNVTELRKEYDERKGPFKVNDDPDMETHIVFIVDLKTGKLLKDYVGFDGSNKTDELNYVEEVA